MRILSVYVSPPGDDAAWWRISNIGRLMTLNGHEVDFVHYCRGKVYETLIERKSDGYNHIYERASRIDAPLRHLKRLLRERYDVIYANTHRAALFSPVSKLVDVPMVFDIHGALVQELAFLNRGLGFSFGRSRGLMETEVAEFLGLTLSDKVVCVSKRMVSYLEGKGIPSKKLANITNGVDLTFFKHTDDSRAGQLREELGFGDKRVFGYIGGYAKWQGIESLLDAARAVKDTNIGFLFVGCGKMPSSDNTRVIPWVPRSQIREYYDACDVLVLPRPRHIATEVAAPTKFAEYAAMGKPILTTPVGDAAELTDRNRCGVVAKGDDTESIGQGIRQVSELNSEELAEMGRNSRKLAEQVFDWDKIGRDLEDVIEEVGRK